MKRLDLSWLTGTQIAIVIGFCLFVAAASWETPLVVELTQHFGIRDSDVGRLMGLQNGLMTLFGLLGGYLSDRYRRTWLWGLGFLMAAASSLIIWIGLRQGISFESFFLLKLITGICLGITGPLAFIMLMDAVPLERRNLMFGILFFMGGMGNALGAFLPSICVSLKWGLEGAYSLLAFLMLASAVLMALSRDPKRGAQDACLKDVLAQGCVEYDFHIRPADIKAVMSKPINLLIGSYSALNLIPMQFISLWMITYLVRSYGMAEVMASLVMMICFFGLVTGNVLGGYVADRPRLRSAEGRIKLAIICAIMAMPFLMASFVSKWPWMGLISLMLVGWTFYGSANPAIGSLGQEVNLPEHRGVWTSFNAIICGVANMACLWAPPIIAEMFGGDYAKPFMLSSLVFMPVVFILLVIRRRIQRDVGHVNNVLAERAEQMQLKLAQELSDQTSYAAGEESVAKRER
jgi:MFS family permease